MSKRVVFGILALACLVAGPAQADEANGAERADKLFSEANALVERGDYAAACPKFAESQRLEPALGTQFNLALCYERTGKPAAAYRAFRAVERLAHASGKRSREDAARQRITDLRPRVAHLKLSSLEQGVTIALDGERIESEEWGFVAVDDGEHRVDATAPAKTPWKKMVTVTSTGERELRVEVPTLEKDTRVVTLTKETSNPRRTAGLVVGAVGAVGLVVAGVTGILIMRDKSKADEKCTPRCVDSDGAEAVSRGKTLLPVNTVAAAVGVVGLGVGAFLFFTAPSKPKTGSVPELHPYLGVGSGGLAGRF
jgi:hypothetical protein